MKKQILLFIVLAGSFFYGLAQQKPSLVEKLTTYQQEQPVEKLYLNFDKPYYAAGDTIWFKAYLLNAIRQASTISDKIHVELYNDSLRLVAERVIQLNNGLGYGDIALNVNIPDGNYTLRAYTNWQQNFNDILYFNHPIYIGNGGSKTWMVGLKQSMVSKDGKKEILLDVRLQNLKKELAGFKDILVSVRNGEKKSSKTFRTKGDGSFELKVPAADDDDPEYIMTILDKKDPSRKAIVPFFKAGTDKTDLQFMPEGGYLVTGIYNKVAFKAIGTNGLGKDISGQIVDQNNAVKAEFTAMHNGMGSFFFLPEPNSNYFAVFENNGNSEKIPLKNIKEGGTVLRIDPLTNKDSVLVYIRATESLQNNNLYQLIAQAEGKIAVAFKFSLKNGFFNIKLPKAGLPEGVINFTLFSPEEYPLNERLVYIPGTKKIAITTITNKITFGKKDSVHLEVSAVDENNQPLMGSFTVAVTDDQLVKINEQEGNIKSYFLLTSNLKGNIENAGWYFKDQDLPKLLALDNLLLTQGWAGFEWKNIQTELPAVKFKAEKGNSVTGQIKSLFGKPLANMQLTLLSLGKNILVTDTITDKNGMFRFSNLPLTDTSHYAIKLKNAKNRASGANFMVNEFTRAKFLSAPKTTVPWYVNTRDIDFNFIKSAREGVELSEAEIAKISGTAIQAVVIKELPSDIGLKFDIDSKLKTHLTHTEFKKAPRLSLFQLIKKFEPAFHLASLPEEGVYFIGGSGVTFRVDNIFMLENDMVSYRTTMLHYLRAQDITDLKIYKSPGGGALIDIKTRSGNGPASNIAIGTYVYRPLPIYISKEFYHPRYNTANNNDQPDNRNTIFWDANVITDAYGKAQLSFYTSDSTGTYSIRIEGTDMKGRFGVWAGKLNVTPGKPNSK